MFIKFFVLGFSILIGSGAQAAAGAMNIYTCTLRVMNATNDVLIEESFQADEINGSHGGDAKNFSSKDGKTQVALAVDGRWILLNWVKENKVIANMIFVVGNPSVEPRAVIIYNPEDTAEQASVDCQPNFQL